VKLLLKESEHEVLRQELSRWSGFVSSMLLGVEAIRACTRYGTEYAADARAWLQDVALMPIDDEVLDRAATVGPPALRALDALHLATALSIKDEIGSFFTYDERLEGAALDQGFTVLHPGDPA
jgi:uncharacterized protein